MRETEEAAPGANRARPEIESQPPDSIPPAPPVQAADSIRVWRIRRAPRRIGARGRDASLAAFDKLDTYRQNADYVWLLAPDGRALVIAEGAYFEILRRAAYCHAPPLDALDLDDILAAEADAWQAGARHE